MTELGYCHQCCCPMGARGCPHTLDEPPVVIAVPDAVRLQVLEELYEDHAFGPFVPMHQRVVQTIAELRERVGGGR